MGLSDNPFAKTYTSFSGVDIIATFAGVYIGELQGVSYSVTREKAPLYTMGSADPRSFSRGKRGISGSLVFLVFDRSALIGRMAQTNPEAAKFIANQNEAAIYGGEGRGIDQAGVSIDAGAVTNDTVSRPEDLGKQYDYAWYADQIPPFDIVIQAANEYGHTARMEIRGVEILNTGSGMSVDDITTDESHTFVARAIKPWYGQQVFDGTGYKTKPKLGN